MSKERKAPRVEVNLPVQWEGVLDRREATITSLSASGCFVLSGGAVALKELLRLELHIPKEDPLYLWAEVVDTAFEIGFAVRFMSPEEENQARLASLIQNVTGPGR